MKIAIVLNGISKKKQFFYQSILPALSSTHDVGVYETKHAGHARELAASAVRDKVDLILSAGGDGTLHQVLNGMFDAADVFPTLGVIPLGSGNDFAGAIGATVNAKAILDLLKQDGKPTDVGVVSCWDSQGNETKRYFINVCSLGMGPATVMQMERMPAWLGADLKYYFSIVKTFFAFKPQSIELNTTDFQWQGGALLLAIANGKSFGNRIYVAPDSRPDDGVFNLLLATSMPLLRFLPYLQTLKAKQKVNDYRVIYLERKKIELKSKQQVALEAEGELIGHLPATIEVATTKVRFLRA